MSVTEHLGTTMCWAYEGSIFISVHAEQPPSDEDWTLYLGDASRLVEQRPGLCAFIFTDGAGPNAEQRKQLAAIPERSAASDDPPTRSSTRCALA